jgi:hypothetical protein
MSTTEERCISFKLDLLEVIAEVQKASDSEAWESIADFFDRLRRTAIDLSERYAIYE